jgi:hypothetical protein
MWRKQAETSVISTTEGFVFFGGHSIVFPLCAPECGADGVHKERISDVSGKFSHKRNKSFGNLRSIHDGGYFGKFNAICGGRWNTASSRNRVTSEKGKTARTINRNLNW